MNEKPLGGTKLSVCDRTETIVEYMKVGADGSRFFNSDMEIT
jgi:hypothetical protein